MPRYRTIVEPDMSDYDYENGFQHPFRDPRMFSRSDREALRVAKDGARWYLSIKHQIERDMDKKKKKDDDKKKDSFKMPTMSVGQAVGIMMVTWPLIGMFEKWAFEAVFH